MIINVTLRTVDLMLLPTGFLQWLRVVWRMVKTSIRPACTSLTFVSPTPKLQVDSKRKNGFHHGVLCYGLTNFGFESKDPTFSQKRARHCVPVLDPSSWVWILVKVKPATVSSFHSRLLQIADSVGSPTR